MIAVLVECVTAYDGDGGPREVLFVDGVEVAQVVRYEIDPDDPMLRYIGTDPWLDRQNAIAATASPAAADRIRTWAAQTAESLAVDDD